jgi:hypothetical protein
MVESGQENLIASALNRSLGIIVAQLIISYTASDEYATLR